jgi:hypothetical protein
MAGPVDNTGPMYMGCNEDIQFTTPWKMQLLPVPTSPTDDIIFGKCAGCKNTLERPHKKCARCKNVGFCGKACQIFNWNNGHKETCEKVPDRKSYAAIVVDIAQGAGALDDILVLLIMTPASKDKGGLYTTPGYNSDVTLYFTITTPGLPDLVLEHVKINMYVHDSGCTYVKCTPLNKNAFLCMKHLPAGKYLITHTQSALTKGPPSSWTEAMMAQGRFDP